MARQRFVKVTIIIIFYNVTRTQITSRNTLVRAQTSDKAADLLAKNPSKIPGSVSGSGTRNRNWTVRCRCDNFHKNSSTTCSGKNFASRDLDWNRLLL